MQNAEEVSPLYQNFHDDKVHFPVTAEKACFVYIIL